MGSPANPARAEWRAHWLLVLAAMAGFSFHSVPTYTIGLFMEPLSAEFGWSRAQISSGLSVASLLTIPLSPLVGALIDKWGSRLLAIVGMVLVSCVIAAFGLANGSMGQWLALWAIYTLVGMGTKATVWTAAVTGCFSAARGLALGVTLCGTAIAQVIAPPLARWLIEEHGWRGAYAWLGFGWGGLCLVLILLFFFDARDRQRQAAAKPSRQPAATPPTLYGLGFREALRNPALIRIAISSFITMFLGVALIVHQVPILVEAGVSRANAAYLASLGGFAGIAGKLATGWMSDRWNANVISGVTLAAPAIAFALLLEPIRTPTLIVVAMIVVGYAAGAKLQICAFLTGQYAGTKNFGKIFGIMTSLFAVGTGFGPVAAGAAYDAFGTYTPFLLVAIPGSLLCGFLVFGLGPRPTWGPQTADRETQGSGAAHEAAARAAPSEAG